MRTRLITVLAAALALSAAVPLASRAQDQTPTATPTASSADAKKNWPKDVQRVYDDYRHDGVIDVCDHTKKTLQDTLDTIEPAYDQDYPDFREALNAGIERHDSGDCASDSSTSNGATTGTPSATATPAGTATPAATTDSGAESGTLPPTDTGSSDSGSGAGTVPPEDDIPPQNSPAPTAVPPAATPAAAAPPVPTPQAQVIVHTGHRSLALPIALIVLALLGGLALAFFAFFGRRNPRVRHAWDEALFRTRGTWADFSDWLRLGR